MRRVAADSECSGMKHGLLREDMRHCWRRVAPQLQLDKQSLLPLVKYHKVRVASMMLRDDARPQA
ncbi:hypothetical protein [Mumia zhuanghuii]|uniref:Uncharacterized protein n=1 Tax=Mumia zhuanghuii TaxID=2585211 RepID=A0A5C4MDA3_9ACTN|nr:hypothetical protein [Mumia zhuanghuii]TNC35591.1 hypothetical protein FHE65_26960 [Mumia zhuanghuii]